MAASSMLPNRWINDDVRENLRNWKSNNNFVLAGVQQTEEVWKAC